MPGSFVPQQLLKRDLLSCVERGTWRGPAESVTAVRRDIRGVPLWTWVPAWLTLRREARALLALSQVDAVPHLLERGRGFLIRTWIEGQPLHAAPPGDSRWYVVAEALVRRIHAAGVTHNDLHKEPNWLVRSDGEPAIVDFQLASRVHWPRWWRRQLECEDIRHTMKHKRKYCGAALTAAEHQLLAHSAWTTRLWRATGKRFYNLITRRILHWSDDEGRGRRRLRPPDRDGNPRRDAH